MNAVPWREWPLGCGPGRVEIHCEVLDVDRYGNVLCPRCRTREPVWLAGEHHEGVHAFGEGTLRPLDQEDRWRRVSTGPPAPPPERSTGPATGPVFSRDRHAPGVMRW